jgi:broad specificity phosphatase PhoE
MSKLFYISHPQVNIDPAIAVPDWSLSELGKARAQAAARSKNLANVRSIYSSTERKAIETAEVLARCLNLMVNVREGLHENDRSATGFVPPQEFEELANAFFANPHESIRGWERAIDAQKRIVGGIGKIIAEASDGDIIVTGHGGVGTLLFCHTSNRPIARQNDQPAGGGNFFAIDTRTKTANHGWRPMEEI